MAKNTQTHPAFCPPFFLAGIFVSRRSWSHTSVSKQLPGGKKNRRKILGLRWLYGGLASMRSPTGPSYLRAVGRNVPGEVPETYQKFPHFSGVGCFMAVLSRWQIPNFPSRWDFIVTNRWHHGFQTISKKKASSHPCFWVSPAIFLIRKSLLSIDASEIRRERVEVGKIIPLLTGL